VTRDLDDLLAAVERTTAHATFAVTASVAVRDDAGAPATSRGYCDLDVPLVASAWTTVGGPSHPGLLHGRALHLGMPEWLSLDVHGIAVSELLPLFWLRATTSAVDTGDGSFTVEVDVDAAADANPPAVAHSLRHDELGPLQAAGGPATGTVHVGPDGLVRRVDLAVGGEDPLTVVLTLEPVARRPLDPAVIVPGADLDAVVGDLIDPRA